MPWSFQASPDVSESYETSARTECNGNSDSVTKILFRSKNVTKCNEKWFPVKAVLVFVTFRYILAPGDIFVTPPIFSLHSVRADAP